MVHRRKPRSGRAARGRVSAVFEVKRVAERRDYVAASLRDAIDSANAHRRLDAVVSAAYGWPADLADDDLLARLLALNLERAVR